MIDHLYFELRLTYLLWSRNTRERLLIALAWGAPRSLTYWCAIRVMSHATTGQYGTSNPNDVSIMEALKRWES